MRVLRDYHLALEGGMVGYKPAGDGPVASARPQQPVCAIRRAQGALGTAQCNQWPARPGRTKQFCFFVYVLLYY